MERKREHIDPESYARRYQLKIFQRAKEGNTIAYLDTGSGKTLIAVLLIKAHGHLIRKPNRKIAVFLVPKMCLVKQQADVIEIHTDLKVGQFWGAMGTDFWDRKKWLEQLAKYEVFVMTPQILLDNLRHCFFEMKMINILIFDECHHARKKHPYACIMNEFYRGENDLPLVFGMTASPKFSKDQACSDIISLEKTLFSRVITLEQNYELEAVVPSPIQLIRYFDVHHDILGVHPVIASLLMDLQIKHCKNAVKNSNGQIYEDDAKRLQDTVKTNNLYTSALLHCLNELGLWCAYLAAQIIESMKNEDNFDGYSFRPEGFDSMSSKFLQEAKSILQSFLPTDCHHTVGNDLESDARNGLITSKVKALVHILQEYRHKDSWKSIVFVHRVISANVLAHFLSTIRCLSPLKCEHLAGNNSGLSRQAHKIQQHIIDQFRYGELHLLVATNIVEEGLDIQKCNLVIRFDLPQIVSSWIQSRGRARKAGSQYVLLVERGNTKQKELVSALQKSEENMKHDVMCRQAMIEEINIPCGIPDWTFQVSSTGATVNLNSSISLIYYYCSQLPGDRYFSPCPKFEFDQKKSSCTLILPPSAPITHITVNGEWHFLKQRACFEACKKLHALNALTEYLVPAREEDNDEVPSDLKGHAELHPQFVPKSLSGDWAFTTDAKNFNSFIISLRCQPPSSWKFIQVLFLLEGSLDEDTAHIIVPLHLGGSVVFAELQPAGRIDLNNDQVHAARRFQEIVLNILVEHTLDIIFEYTVWRSDCQYLLLPMQNHDVISDIDPPLIDWKCILDVSSSVISEGSLTGMDCGTDSGTKNNSKEYHVTKQGDCLYTENMIMHTEKMLDCLVSTTHNEKLYCVTNVLCDMNLLSAFSSENTIYCSFYDYYKKKYDLNLKYCHQPLIEASPVCRAANLLSRLCHVSSNSDKKVGISTKSLVKLPPEICRVRARGLSINILYTFSFMPSIMHRIESMLVSMELRQKIANECPMTSTIPSTKILEALTHKGCEETFSYETLETLGDSFLKYSVSQHLFQVHSQKHEGQLTTKRGSQISNYSLYKLAVKKSIPGYIRTKKFEPSTWQAPGLVMRDRSLQTSNKLQNMGPEPFNGKGKNNFHLRLIKSKTVADVVEALIGAHLQCGNAKTTMEFMIWLGIEIKMEPTLNIKIPQDTHIPTADIYNLCSLSKVLNYKFRDPRLLLEAVTHASCQESYVGCYQRLEFLGDAALDFLLTTHFFESYENLNPGLLSDLRSSATNNDYFGQVAVKWNLQRYLRHASGKLHSQITDFVGLTKTKNEIFGWLDGKVPKVLADLVESIAGAILVDSNYDTEKLWRVMKPLLEPIVTPTNLPYHPVRELGELCAKQGFRVEYKTHHEAKCRVTVAKVAVRGMEYEEKAEDIDKKTAKKSAAIKMLKLLQDLNLIT